MGDSIYSTKLHPTFPFANYFPGFSCSSCFRCFFFLWVVYSLWTTHELLITHQFMIYVMPISSIIASIIDMQELFDIQELFKFNFYGQKAIYKSVIWTLFWNLLQFFSNKKLKNYYQIPWSNSLIDRLK